MKSKYIRLLTILLVLSIFAALSGTAYAAVFSDSGSIGQPYKKAVAEIDIAPAPDASIHEQPTGPGPPGDERPNNNGNGDILLPEVP